jgi:hypothetical protein
METKLDIVIKHLHGETALRICLEEMIRRVNNRAGDQRRRRH